MLDAGSLTVLGQHFERLMSAIQTRVENVGGLVFFRIFHFCMVKGLYSRGGGRVDERWRCWSATVLVASFVVPSAPPATPRFPIPLRPHPSSNVLLSRFQPPLLSPLCNNNQHFPPIIQSHKLTPHLSHPDPAHSPNPNLDLGSILPRHRGRYRRRRRRNRPFPRHIAPDR